MGILEAGDHDLERFFETALDHLVVAGYDGYFKRLSRAWTETLGWSEEEFRARPIHEFAHPDDRATLLNDRDAIKRGIPLIGRVNRYLHKDGSFRWLEWRTVAYPERQLIYAVARDVTQQKLAEAERERARAELIIAERMASLGRLAAGVAHEVNNPLAFMMSNLRMSLEELERRGEALADVREMLVDVLDGAERVRRIVQALRTIADAEVERRAPVELRQVVELALSMVGADVRRRARLVEVYLATPEIHLDEARLGQAIVNLLLNAIDAIPPGAPLANEIRISTSTDEAGSAVLEIQDSGSGIPATHLGRIFEPFFTTKPVGQGTGLGLPIARSLVTGMGGEITVASEEGHGTTFRLAFPALRRPS
jgi:PAS domain S-box-containing protein